MNRQYLVGVTQSMACSNGAIIQVHGICPIVSFASRGQQRFSRRTETCFTAVALPWSFARSVGDTVGAYAFVTAKAEAAVIELVWRCAKYACHGFGGFEASLRGRREKKVTVRETKYGDSEGF